MTTFPKMMPKSLPRSSTLLAVTRVRGFGVRALAAAGLLAVSAQAAVTIPVYWDTNGATAGTSNTGGVWATNSGSNWTTNDAGTSTTGTWNAKAGTGNDTLAVFSAGTNGTGTFSVAVSGSINNVGGITFEEGNVAITGGTLVLSQDATITTTVSGSISSAINGSKALIKAGNASLTLSGSNNFSGGLWLGAGQLNINGNAVLGSGTLVFAGGNIDNTSGAAITNNNFNTAQAWLSNFTFGGTNDLNLGTGAVTLLGTRTVTTTAGNLTVGGAISGSGYGINKAGNGTLTLSGNSTFTGAVAVTDGTLVARSNNALGAGTSGTTVSSGATLQLDNNIATQNGTLTIAGTGHDGNGALANGTGNNRWAGNIALSGNATIENDGTGTLALGNTSPTYNRAVSDPSGSPTDTHTIALGSNTLTLSGSNTIYANGRITGTGNVVVDMTNAGNEAWFTANRNTFTGSTTVKNGTLILDTLYNTYPNDPAHPNFFGINGPLVIGDGTGAANTARVTVGSGTLNDELMNFTSTVAINQDGRWNLGAAQTIAGLTMTGGSIELGSTGGLYLNGDVTINASAGNTATINGTGTSTLSMTTHQGPSPVPNATRTFNVVGGVGNTSDLTVNATINNGSLVKTGAGTMTILNSNSGGYEGTTTVNNGILNIQNGSALGQANATDATGTTVNGNGATNGTLQLQGGITVSNEKLTLNNTGFNNNGALQNVSGNNTWAGPISLASNSRVQSDAGTLTLGGTVTSTSNATLDVRGAGNTTISGAVGTGSGGITKSGTGTLTLSGNNTYSGATTVNQGVLSLQSNTGLGSGAGTTTVAGNGAALQLDNTAIGGGSNALNTTAEPLALIGTGIGGTGALRNVAGNNTFGGQITVASAALVSANPGVTSSLITANSGTTMTLSGGITSSAGSSQNLTIGTTAQNGNVNVTGAVNLGAMSLTKAGSGTLTFSSANNTVGQTQIAAGTLAVSSGKTLNTAALGAAAGSTLAIASGGTVSSTYAAGTTTFSGAISAPGGEFEKLGAGTLQFANTSFNAGSGSLLTLGGGSLSLLGSQITFDTIHITANTILDFNGSANTFLSSANLIIDAGVTVTVNNWVSVANNAAQSTEWYLRSAPGTGGVLNNSITLGATDRSGGAGLSQIVFNNYNGLTTTWVSSGVSNGWFSHEIRPTPEPSTYGAILLGGCVGLLGWRRYRRKAQQG